MKGDLREAARGPQRSFGPYRLALLQASEQKGLISAQSSLSHLRVSVTSLASHSMQPDVSFPFPNLEQRWCPMSLAGHLIRTENVNGNLDGFHLPAIWTTHSSGMGSRKIRQPGTVGGMMVFTPELAVTRGKSNEDKELMRGRRHGYRQSDLTSRKMCPRKEKQG